MPVDDEVWRWFTTPFVHDSLGYQFVALLGVGIFGTLLERRFGPVPVVVVFVLAGAAGAALAVTLEVPPLLERPASTRCWAPTARRWGCCSPGSWTTGWRRAAARSATTT